MQRSIFRKVALDRLASPEQLDQLVTLPPPLRWRIPHDRPSRAALRLGGSAAAAVRRVRTPTVLQMEAVECGAAALAMVLGFYGRFVSLAELRTVCGVSRDGSKASNILRAAQSYGLLAKGYKKDIDALHALPLPLIVFWNFNHFVVVDGFGPDVVYLNDPASGPRTVDAAEFDQAYTGVVLAFSRSPDFVPGGQRPTRWAIVRAQLAGQRWLVLLAAVCALILAAPLLVFPLLLQRLIDGLLGAGSAPLLPTLLVALLLTAVLQAGMAWLVQLVLLRLELRQGAATARRVFEALLRLPIPFFTQRSTGEIAARIALAERTAALLASNVLPALLGSFTLVGATLLMLRYDWALALAVLGLALLSLGLPALLRRSQSDQRRRLLQEQAQLDGVGYAGLHAIETLKATGGETGFFGRWAGMQARVVNSAGALARADQLQLALPAALGTLATAVLVVGGGWRVAHGALSLGGLVALQSLAAILLDPLSRLARLPDGVGAIAQNVDGVADVVDHPPAVPATVFDPPAPAPALQGHVELRNVSFGYSPMAPPLIADLSLVLAPGRRVALVGGSGSGKSTVAKLVAGLYEPWQGEILFDGRPRSAYAPAVLSSSLALVDQEIAIFAGSIRDNLAMWDASVSEDTIVAAARDALLDAEIRQRPGGYDARLADGGYELSGGQRQRLEIARGLVRQPAILILDEATSALDPLAEELVDAHIRRRGCACLIVAHRLSTVRDADEIIVLERGQVVQRGTHAALAEAEGPYRRLMQADAPEAMSHADR